MTKQKLKTKNVTKLKKMQQNELTLIVTKLISYDYEEEENLKSKIVTKLRNSNCDKTQKLKLEETIKQNKKG